VVIGDEDRARGTFASAARMRFNVASLTIFKIQDPTQEFYLALGFEESPIEPMTFMVTLADVRKSLE
jgi:hypothetical protein